MNKIIRWYNSNRGIFWAILLAFGAIVLLIQVLNIYYKNNAKNETIRNSDDSDTSYNNSSTNYSIMIGERASGDIYYNVEKIIDSFMDYCNNGKIEEAYNLLAEDCKEELFPNVQDFKRDYYDKVFNRYKRYSIELWIENDGTYTYIVHIKEDSLATGQVSDVEIQDYYTINEENKLNIANYIGMETVDVEKSINDINIKILSKDIYMDYVKYNLIIENDTNYTINLDGRKNTTSTYITDVKGLKYISYIHEISNSEFTIRKGNKIELKIKFNKGYKPEQKEKSLTFSDVILNYDEYRNITDKEKYINRLNLQIDF